MLSQQVVDVHSQPTSIDWIRTRNCSLTDPYWDPSRFPSARRKFVEDLHCPFCLMSRDENPESARAVSHDVERIMAARIEACLA